MTKTYTAQEMRELADKIWDYKTMPKGLELCDNELEQVDCEATHDLIYMLRQAAELMEREKKCETVFSTNKELNAAFNNLRKLIDEKKISISEGMMIESKILRSMEEHFRALWNMEKELDRCNINEVIARHGTALGEDAEFDFLCDVIKRAQWMIGSEYDAEYETNKCPFCGCDVNRALDHSNKWFIFCRCGYQSVHCVTLKTAVASHNRMVKSRETIS